MKIHLVFCTLFIAIRLAGISQTYEVNVHVRKLIDSAKRSFCKGDTSGTIGFLEEIEKRYPNDAAIIVTNKALADLYLARNKVKEAKQKMLYAFSYKPVNYYSGYQDTDICNKILKSSSISSAKADLCVAISQLYLHEGNFDNSILFLNLADNKDLPYQNCGNGMIMYKSFLSLYFADYYLKVGDTTKAIARLLDFFMKRDGNRVGGLTACKR